VQHYYFLRALPLEGKKRFMLTESFLAQAQRMRITVGWDLA
jgi:hypothetical protein